MKGMRRTALWRALVLLTAAGLVLLSCLSGCAAAHICDHSPECHICQAEHVRRHLILLTELFVLLSAGIFLYGCCQECFAAAGFLPTLVSLHVQMNN